MIRLLSALTLAIAVAPWAAADETVVNSKHDLSTFGPGPVRAVNEDRVCIFCHAPHNTKPATPLWNRHDPTTYYRVYTSSTTDARVDQPAGASKMCLSCHDGSVALGLTLNRPPTDPIPLTHPFMPSGPTNLTNDLSDDHPIGLRYDRTLSNLDPQIREPALVSRDIELGPLGELECTACHDPHNNELGNFLRITEREGALCNTCHRLNGWQTSSHANSAAAVPAHVTNGELLAFPSMHDNACLSCHKTHSAPQRARLLRDRGYDLCVGCHDGLTGRNVLSVLSGRSGHRVNRVRDIHDPAEDPHSMRPHVDCNDCHNPHAARTNPLGNAPASSGSQSPLAPPAMERVPGVTLSGTRTARATFYYEVCFRCHADNPAPVAGRIARQRDTGGNVRRQFLPTATSAHPVTFTARGGAEVPSLRTELRTRKFINCQDCHNNPDARQRGGATANGPHGSRYPFLLAARYETADSTIESPQAYALCYECHDRNSILGDESFALHSRHVVRDRTPCSACHAPHGVDGGAAQHGHLINFDISIVGAERFYVDTGRFRGSCTLTCHSVRHVNFSYGN